MKNLQTYLLCIFLLIAALSCNSEKKKMIKGLTGAYFVDTTKGDYKILRSFIPENLRLVLSKNGSYYFDPKTEILKGYNGKWDLSDDWEISNYIFKCENGQVQTNRFMNISIQKNKAEYTIYFDKKDSVTK